MPDAFRELSDFEIDRLDDARLLAYIRAAREADPAAATNGTRHLIFRHMPSVVARVRRKVPPHLADDVAHDALVEALSAAFAGTTPGEFHKWLNVIVSRSVADFYRGPRGRQLRLDREAAPQLAGELPPQASGEEGGYGEAEVQQLIDSLMAARSELHRRVVDMLVWGGYSAREAAEATGLGEDNCYQIVRRFRVELRAALDTEAAP
jgi:RNA polymerase sigma factor (sigma-70 family)